MKDGKCPKCNSTQIYSQEGMLLKGGPFGSNSIPVSLTSMAALDNFVCTECGLVESYVADEDKLREISKKWKKFGSRDAAEEKSETTD
jgi:predicted nucleic-acid-binding Zn-ribbon protein